MNESSRARVVIVCTANVIRSPFVEHLLRARMTAAGVDDVSIASAGTAARPGRPAEPRVTELGRAYGIDLDGHRSRRLDEATLSPDTIVLCAAAVHRRVVLDMRPDALDTTFTVREFARLLRTAEGRLEPAADPASLVRSIARWRMRARPASIADDDLVDPIGQSSAVWREFERDAVPAVETIAAQLARVLVPRIDGRSAGPLPLTRRAMRLRRDRGENGIPSS